MSNNFALEQLIRGNRSLADRDAARRERQERVDRDGSPFFPYILPVTNATLYTEIDIRTLFPAARKYEPLDFLEVINHDLVDITLNFNGMSEGPQLVPAGAIVTFKDKAVWMLRITNIDAAVDTILGSIRLSFQRMAMTADKKARGF